MDYWFTIPANNSSRLPILILLAVPATPGWKIFGKWMEIFILMLPNSRHSFTWTIYKDQKTFV
jgi:hypothetical protein